MPLRYIKVPRVDPQDVLHIAVSTTSLMRELSSMSFFPPATAAVSIVLLILQTVQGVQNNKEACFRLARRGARILLDINDQMDGRWNTAPPTLIRNLENFQRTLTSINEFMKALTATTWTHRFRKKSFIENAIIEYSVQLEDAAQSFQIATLIDIHYAISAKPTEVPNSKVILPPPPYVLGDCESERIVNQLHHAQSQVERPSDTAVNPLDSPTPSSDSAFVDEPQEEQSVDGHIISEETLDSHGFRRYHQSEVRLKGRSTMKGGWWAGTSPAEVEGHPTLIKRYEGPAKYALKAWLNDVKVLQTVFHSSLPQMIGFSDEGATTPFILLSYVQTRSPQSLLLHTLETSGLAACAGLILRFYQDVMDATLYMQQQKKLDNTQAQDFLDGSSFRVGGSNTIILGLPPPKSGWITVRNYGLTESLRKVVMDMLPGGGTVEFKQPNRSDNRDLTHLVMVANGLMPTDDSSVSLSPRAQVLAGIWHEDNDDIDGMVFRQRSNLNLRQLRLSNLDANAHEHTWKENGGIPPFKFSVGDLGYIPHGKTLDDFVLLGNVIRDGLANFDVQNHVYGTQWSWENFPIRHAEMEPFPLPADITCWIMAVPPNSQIDCQIAHSTMVQAIADAWRFLLLKGKDLALEHQVAPEELILITRAGTNQDFYIRDFRSPHHFGGAAPRHNLHPKQPSFMQHRPNWNSPSQPRLFTPPHHNNLPTIMYLQTSGNPAFKPYWSHSPIPLLNGAQQPELKHGWTYKIGWCTGFIHWIQLHPEDFAD